MSVQMSLLAILADAPGYGLQLRNEFETRTGSIWSLNVGQVYTTLARLERDGFVEQRDGDGAEKLYAISPGVEEAAPATTRPTAVRSAAANGQANVRPSARTDARRHATSGPSPISSSSGSPNVWRKKS